MKKPPKALPRHEHKKVWPSILIPPVYLPSVIHTLTSSYEFGCVLLAAVNSDDKLGSRFTAMKLSSMTHISLDTCFEAMEKACQLGLAQRVYVEMNTTQMTTIYTVCQWVCVSGDQFGETFLIPKNQKDLGSMFQSLFTAGVQWRFQSELVHQKKAKDLMRRWNHASF